MLRLCLTRAGVALAVFAGLSFSAGAMAAGWDITFEDGSACVAREFRPYHEPRQQNDRHQARVRAEYAANPSNFGLYISHASGLGAKRTPFGDLAELKFSYVDRKMNVGARVYLATTLEGRTLNEMQDGSGMLRICPHTAQGPNDCARVYYLGVMCEGGEERVVRFDMMGHGVTPVRNYTYLSRAVPIDEATLVQRRESLEQAKQAAERRQAQLSQIAAEQNEQARLQNVRAAERMQAMMRDAPINSVMFCTSAGLLPAGGVITSLVYKCDLTGSQVVDLRKAIELGWDVATETRSPQRTLGGGTALEVSVQLRKTR